jgi:hypothetical protein
LRQKIYLIVHIDEWISYLSQKNLKHDWLYSIFIVATVWKFFFDFISIFYRLSSLCYLSEVLLELCKGVDAHENEKIIFDWNREKLVKLEFITSQDFWKKLRSGLPGIVLIYLFVSLVVCFRCIEKSFVFILDAKCPQKIIFERGLRQKLFCDENSFSVCGISK